ncbi:MAG: polyhydroxyalkanoate depolymerase [Verrucomicrobiales bacterium]|nr:polyhydroxyalkanoate depolymerase [Verrucomicrobiales bacterium]
MCKLTISCDSRVAMYIDRINPASWRFASRATFVLVFFLSILGAFCQESSANRSSAILESALSLAGTNRSELNRALSEAPPAQREGLEFLIQNMPESDLTTLSSGFLLDHLAAAYRARSETSWAQSVPNDIFLNDVLPYASINEHRETWRKVLHDICAPLIVGATGPGDAAKRINEKLFSIVKVKYSTERKKADQSPSESMESGKATCTGLSVLLVDACRSVGVPARIAGTPLWANNRGNHTWVEVWDGDWHFTGAAEQDAAGLDRGWFVHDASQATKESREHAIYASSFKKTGLSFPMVWAPRIRYVNAVNVTDRYTPHSKPAEGGRIRLLVKVLDHPGGKRVNASVTVAEMGESPRTFEGRSKDESADLNDILPFELSRTNVYEIHASLGDKSVRERYRPSTNAQDLVVLPLSDTPVGDIASRACYYVPSAKTLKTADKKKIVDAATAYFISPTNKQSSWKFSKSLERLLENNEPAVRQAVWEAYRNAPVHGGMRKDFEAKQVSFGQYRSAYTVKIVGTRPATGWPMFIAMHGGGNAPKEINDNQWQVMQRYYHDHPEAGGYLYVALRAPNDSWNGFYDVYVYPLIANLIQEFTLFADVNPNKVFIMGYSHGGYGAFAIGPKMPDHFAAIHASAGAPTDGETTAKTLRNTSFSYMVGEKDTAYGRIERNRKFDQQVREFRGDRKDLYPVTLTVVTNWGHTGLPDREIIAEMYPEVRNPVPRELSWVMTDSVIKDFFWLHVSAPEKNQEVDATCNNNHLTVSTTNVKAASILLDGRLINFREPLEVVVNGKIQKYTVKRSLTTLCRTLAERGDPDLAFSAELPLKF